MLRSILRKTFVYTIKLVNHIQVTACLTIKKVTCSIYSSPETRVTCIPTRDTRI